MLNINTYKGEVESYRPIDPCLDIVERNCHRDTLVEVTKLIAMDDIVGVVERIADLIIEERGEKRRQASAADVRFHRLQRFNALDRVASRLSGRLRIVGERGNRVAFASDDEEHIREEFVDGVDLGNVT